MKQEVPLFSWLVGWLIVKGGREGGILGGIG